MGILIFRIACMTRPARLAVDAKRDRSLNLKCGPPLMAAKSCPPERSAIAMLDGHRFSPM